MCPSSVISEIRCQEKAKNTAVKYKPFSIAMPCGLKSDIGTSLYAFEYPMPSLSLTCKRWIIYANSNVPNLVWCRFLRGAEERFGRRREDRHRMPDGRQPRRWQCPQVGLCRWRMQQSPAWTTRLKQLHVGSQQKTLNLLFSKTSVIKKRKSNYIR